ncbi:hypothetical protein DM02DRAFT_665555 [Periconia macrospinosa]|uniref:Hikeshi-like C-terminal domain-containing protein n=1 Tax=Periconia macrospinosa TaxID=97972 RepID=A0A2V1CY25_9PLEO|nr:hypothetical protein DM02DRAFT_665555 [Periconia macrospinosa]
MSSNTDMPAIEWKSDDCFLAAATLLGTVQSGMVLDLTCDGLGRSLENLSDTELLHVGKHIGSIVPAFLACGAAPVSAMYYFTATTKVLAQRIIKNCYDLLTSWGSGDTVPLKAFKAWWIKFEDKIERDPSFLERSDEN